MKQVWGMGHSLYSTTRSVFSDPLYFDVDEAQENSLVVPRRQTTRRRTKFDLHQVRKMEELFQRNMYPKMQERLTLSNQTNLSQDKIQANPIIIVKNLPMLEKF